MKTLKINSNGYNQDIIQSCIENLKSWYGKSFDDIEELIIEDDTRKFYSNKNWIKMQDFCLANKKTHALVMRDFLRIGSVDYVYAIIIKQEPIDMSKLNALVYDDELNGSTPIFLTEKQNELYKYNDLID